MKKILILALAVAAMGVSACSDPEPKHVYHHHYYHDSGPAVGTPTNEGSDNFHAVTKPDTYSQ